MVRCRHRGTSKAANEHRSGRETVHSDSEPGRVDGAVSTFQAALVARPSDRRADPDALRQVAPGLYLSLTPAMQRATRRRIARSSSDTEGE